MSKTSQWEACHQNIQLSSQEIHVWLVNLKTISDSIPTMYSLLSFDEINKANEFKAEQHKVNYILTRGSLRKILTLYLQVEAEEIKFLYNEYGKPYLDSNYIENSLYFNLSHSDDLAIFAISKTNNLGIDLEKIKSIDDYLNIAQENFSQQEVADLMSYTKDEQLAAFYRCWTRKEAFIKAIGDGLSYPLNQFTVSLKTKELGLIQCWSIHSLIPIPGFESALAFDGHCDQLRYYLYT